MCRWKLISHPQKPALYCCYFISLSITVLFQPLWSPYSPAFLSIFSGPLLEFKSLIIFQASSCDICHYFSYLEFPSHLDVSWKKTGACNMGEHRRGIALNLSGGLSAWGENWTKLSLFFLSAKPTKVFGGGGGQPWLYFWDLFKFKFNIITTFLRHVYIFKSLLK